MASTDKEVGNFLEKVKDVVKEGSLDLSSDEDLSIGIMNLISIEEHLFFTANTYDHVNGDTSMTTNTNKAVITQNPVWFITGCSTGFGRELAKHVPEPVGI